MNTLTFGDKWSDKYIPCLMYGMNLLKIYAESEYRLLEDYQEELLFLCVDVLKKLVFDIKKEEKDADADANVDGHDDEFSDIQTLERFTIELVLTTKCTFAEVIGSGLVTALVQVVDSENTSDYAKQIATLLLSFYDRSG